MVDDRELRHARKATEAHDGAPSPLNPGGGPPSWGGTAHLVLVMGAGLLAAAASVALTAGGVRARDGRTVLLGCAFSTMTALLAVHGLATPGVLFGPTASSRSPVARRCRSAQPSSR